LDGFLDGGLSTCWEDTELCTVVGADAEFGVIVGTADTFGVACLLAPFMMGDSDDKGDVGVVKLDPILASVNNSLGLGTGGSDGLGATTVTAED
jgi:hypothetical protein